MSKSMTPSVQVRLVDDVEVDDPERADPGRSQVQQRRAAEPTGADHQDLRVLQAFLPVDPDVRDDQVTAVAGDLVLGQLRSRLHQRRQTACHGFLLDA
jgi:hypothetical protein